MMRGNPLLARFGDYDVFSRASSSGDLTAPTITSSATVSIVEGNAFAMTLTANEAVAWSKIGGPDANLFVLSGANLSLAAKDYAVPLDANADGLYVVQIAATDAAGNTTTQTVTVGVTRAVDNRVTPTMTLAVASQAVPTTALRITSLSLAASAASVNAGAQLVLTATLSGGSSAVGKVTFYDFGVAIGVVSLSNGSTAVLQISSLDARAHAITAAYSGDAANAGSISTTVPVTVVPIAAAPVNTAAPTISGGTTAGSVLTATKGSWSNSPTTYAYQWFWADTGDAISGATSASYTTVAADVGHKLDVGVTASNATGSASATSAATGTITAASAAGVTILNDTFSTTTDGTFLSSHVSDSGTGWAAQPNVTVDVAAKLSGGRVWNPASAAWTNTFVANFTAPGADYYVEAVLDCQTVIASEHVGITARASLTAHTLYFARYNRGSNAWQLYKTVDGTSTVLGSFADATFTANTSKTLRLTVKGSTISVAVNGTSVISVTDTSISAAGAPGIRMGGATQTASTGTQITSLVAVTI